MAEQTEIGYEGKEWQSYQTGGTLVRATDLNNMEQGISDACAGVDELRTKRLPTYVVAQDGDTATQDVYMEDILGPCLILDLATRTTYYETGGDEEGHRKAITSGDDIDELRDSLSRMTAPDAASTDLLLIDPSNPSDPSMRPGSVVAEDCTTLSGRPDAWTSGAAVAYRLPILLGGFVSLVLVEAVPQRRVWLNAYNAGAARWEGWQQV